MGEGAHLGGWEMAGIRREEGRAGSRSVNGAGLCEDMGVRAGNDNEE